MVFSNGYKLFAILEHNSWDTIYVNIFLQQSLNESGLPFLLSPENAEYMKAKAAARLKAEIQKGWESVQTETDWVDEKDAYRMLGVEE